MAPDFDAIDFGADVICMVDHPVRQPKEPLLDDLQMVRHARIFQMSVLCETSSFARVEYCNLCAQMPKFGDNRQES